MSNAFPPTADDWYIAAVALMKRLGGKVELTTDEIADARELADPAKHQTQLVTYHASLLTPNVLTLELRSRSREIIELLRTERPAP